MYRILTALILSTLVIFSAGKTRAQPPAWELPLTFKVVQPKGSDPVQQQKNFYAFIWKSFIALNWPNEELAIENGRIVTGERGKPDESKPLGYKLQSGEFAPTVWENYKEPFEVFPESRDWNDPTFNDWNTVRPAPPAPNGKGAVRLPLGFNGLTGYATDTNQPYFFPHYTAPLYDRNGNALVYEVAVNRAFFRYVRYFKYYDADEQIKAVNNYIAGKRDETAFQRPPFGNSEETGPEGYLHDLPKYAQTGLVDVKAAWRVLEASDDKNRYLHRRMVVGFENDGPLGGLGTPQIRTVGLVALHILRWTPNGYCKEKKVDGAFVASTFEQIDNVQSNGNVPASFNHGNPTAEELEYGFSGPKPAVIAEGTPYTPNKHLRVNVFRATSQKLPDEVVKVNKQHQQSAPVKGTPFQYYQLIGTQNHHQGPYQIKNPTPQQMEAQLETNGHQGPLTGVYTNANNLVNSALESYTQKNFSCILCHVRARPYGVLHKKGTVPTFPPRAFEDDHFKILTFLLQLAKSKDCSDNSTDTE